LATGTIPHAHTACFSHEIYNTWAGFFFFFFGRDAFLKATIRLRMRLAQTRRMRHREFKFNRKGSTVWFNNR
jgi:hypothetical protein